MKKILIFFWFVVIGFNVKAQIDSVLYVGVDTVLCTNGSFGIKGNLPDTIYTYYWRTDDFSFLPDEDSINIDQSYLIYVSALDADSLFILDSVEVNQDTILVDSFFYVFNSLDTIDLQHDTINVEIRNIPIPDFFHSPQCFGEESFIINNSIFNDSSIVEYMIGGQLFVDDSPEVSYELNTNGSTELVHVSISQLNDCIVIDSFMVSNLLEPISSFVLDPTCENETVLFDNNSSSTTSTFTTTVLGSNFDLTFSTGENISLSDTLSDGIYNFTFIVENENGCIDSSILNFDILNVDYVNITITDKSGNEMNDLEFCQFDPSELLISNQSGGMFEGQGVINLNNGTAELSLDEIGSSIPITYTYTNDNQCTDSYSISLVEIHPLPNVFFDGLEMAYCQFDSSSIINGSEQNGVFEAVENLSNLGGTEYLFDPIVTGNFQLTYSFTDENGCYNDITKETVVNELPIINLDSEVFIEPGVPIIIGDPNPNSDVNYNWSTGENTSIIEVAFPGVYAIFAQNNFTGCESSDTVLVKLSTSIHSFGIEKLNVYPNPVDEILYVHGLSDFQSIRLFDMNGKEINLNMASIKTHGGICFSKIHRGLYYLIIDNFPVKKIIRK